MSRRGGGSEHVEQAKLVGMIRASFPGALVFAVPNGGLRDRRVAARLKAEGVLAGVPDLVVAEPRGRWHGLFVEVKKPGVGRLSDAQRRRIVELDERGYATLVADRGAEAALADVEAYLRGRWLLR